MCTMGDDPFDPARDPIARRVSVGLAKIGLALRSQAWQEAAGRGLTPTQGQALALLLGSAAPLRLSQLAEGLGVTAATASDAVQALVAKGLVRKERSREDARALAVSLTPAGREEAARAASWPDFLLHAIDELSAAEQEVFLKGLIKMIRALQERGQIPVARMCVTCRFFRPNAHPDPDRPHHCAFVNAPFGDRNLRIDCPDYQSAEAGAAASAVP